MAEYIERETALNKAREILRGEECDCEFIPVIFEVLQGLPAADVAPVVRGRWEPHKDYLMERSGFWECSSCRKMARDTTEYCPNCGARMTWEG